MAEKIANIYFYIYFCRLTSMCSNAHRGRINGRIVRGNKFEHYNFLTN